MSDLAYKPLRVQRAEFIAQVLERLDSEASVVAVGGEFKFKARTSLCRSYVLDSRRYEELVNLVKRTAKELGFSYVRLSGDEFYFTRIKLASAK